MVQGIPTLLIWVLIGLLIPLGAGAAPTPTSMYFDGVDDYLRVTNPTTFNGATKATWSLWFKYRTSWASGGDAALISRTDTGQKQFSFRADQGTGQHAGTLRFTINPTPSTTASWRTPPYLGLSATAFNARVKNAWNHLVVVFDGTQVEAVDRLQVYRNGVLMEGQGKEHVANYTGTFPRHMTTLSAQDLFIGVSNQSLGNRFRDGLMDELAVWAEMAATPGQVAEIFNAGTPGDLNQSALGPPHHWWRGDGNFNDSGTRANHATQVGGVTFAERPQGFAKRQRGRFAVSSFKPDGHMWEMTTEEDLCGGEVQSCGTILTINWRTCLTTGCNARRAQWEAAITKAHVVTIAGYQVDGLTHRAWIEPAEPGADIFDESVVSTDQWLEDLPLRGWTTCHAGNTDCTFCVHDVLNNFASIERRSQHQAAFDVLPGHSVDYLGGSHYQGIARLPDNIFSIDPVVDPRTPIFAITAHGPGRLWLLPMNSKGDSGGEPFPQLWYNAKIGTNRLEWGVDEGSAALPLPAGATRPYDHTHGLYLLQYGDHLGGLQAAGAHWLAVATDAIETHEGGALIVQTDSLAMPWPRHIVDKVIDNNVYLEEWDAVGAVGIVKLDSGFYLLDLQSHQWHAFFLSNTKDLTTTDAWRFIGQRSLDTHHDGLDSTNYQSISLIAQCSDGQLFMTGASNTAEWDWGSDDRMAIHTIGGTVRVLRTADRIVGIRDPNTHTPWSPSSSYDGSAGRTRHMGESATFVKMDTEIGFSPYSYHFHLNTTDFRAGSSVFTNGNGDMMVYAVEKESGDHVRLEEFTNHNSTGLVGDNTCDTWSAAWLALYESTSCTATASHAVLIFDQYFALERAHENLNDFNDFNDKARCVRACVPAGRTWQVCEHAGYTSCQTYAGTGAVQTVVLPTSLQAQVSSVRMY